MVSLRDQILSLFFDYQILHLYQLYHELPYSKHSIRARVYELMKEGRIERVRRGVYQLPPRIEREEIIEEEKVEEYPVYRQVWSIKSLPLNHEYYSFTLYLYCSDPEQIRDYSYEEIHDKFFEAISEYFHYSGDDEYVEEIIDGFIRSSDIELVDWENEFHELEVDGPHEEVLT